jgi:N-acetyl-D-muramate 6-phosphate phosphatase
MIDAVLFDLDGTLADTAPDLAGAINRLLAEKSKTLLEFEPARRRASGGARGLIKAGFGIDPGHAEYPALQERFLDLYEANVCLHTRLFPEIPPLLAALESRSITWGIVTNKVARFTLPLVGLLGLHERAACIVSGDSAPLMKPAPDLLLLASRQIGIAPERCLYLGDDRRDIDAARAAGMPVIAAGWGYLGDGEDPRDWNADALIQSPLQTLNFLGRPPSMG